MTPRTGSILAQPDPIPVYRHTYTPSTENAVPIDEGDQVRHKIMDYLNNGLPLHVLATNNNQALCSYTEEFHKAPVITWYEKTELVLVSSVDEEDQFND